MWNTSRLCLLIAAFAVCSGNPASGESTPVGEPAAPVVAQDMEGLRYIQALVSAIDSADRIVVTEHSFEDDAYDWQNEKPLLDKPVVYATRELSKAQIAAFRSALSALDPKTQDAFSACRFSPHHTVSFLRSGKEQSALRICFECAQVEWAVTSVAPPWSLYGGLRAFISRIGLHPEQDWRALAMAHVR